MCWILTTFANAKDALMTGSTDYISMSNYVHDINHYVAWNYLAVCNLVHVYDWNNCCCQVLVG